MTALRAVLDHPGPHYREAVIIGLAVTAVGLALRLLAHRWCPPGRRFPGGRIARGLYAVLILSGLTLGATAWWGTLRGTALAGWRLLGHMAAAGPFLVLLATFGVLWARDLRLVGGSPRFGLATRLAFLVALISGATAAGSMLLMMLPLLATDEMEAMLDVHRYAGLGLVLAFLVHAGLLLLARRAPEPGGRAD